MIRRVLIIKALDIFNKKQNLYREKDMRNKDDVLEEGVILQMKEKKEEEKENGTI
jgi:hypothetical protein